MGRLSGQVVVITGASRGIGQAIARACRREEMRLVLTARGRDALDQFARSLDPSGEHVLAMAGDVARTRTVLGMPPVG